MDPRRVAEGDGQTVGMRQLPGKRQCLVISLERLLGKPQEPKTKGGLRPTGHAGILPVSEGQGRVLLAVVDLDPLIELAERRPKLPAGFQRYPHRLVGHHEEVRVVHGLRYAAALVSQLIGFPGCAQAM